MAKKSGKNKTPSKPVDNDTMVFISMAQEHKDEGNKLFQKKDYEGSILKYQKSLLLLPKNHIDVSYLRSSIASCYMQMGITDFPKAIHECNLALEVTPKYSKALVKRARCYEALNMPDLALRDISLVLEMEPKNLMAMEIANRVKPLMEKKLTKEETKSFMLTENGSKLSEEEIEALRVTNYVEDSHKKPVKEKTRKKKSKKIEQIDEKKDEGDFEKISDGNCPKKLEEKAEKKIEEIFEKIGDEKCPKKFEEKDEKIEVEPIDVDKLVVEEKISGFIKEDEHKRSIKLVYGDDIRWAKIPFNCNVFELREVISDRFPVSRAVLMKYKDQEGDMVTITTNEELRWAESTSGQHGSVKLHIIEVNPEQDPFFDHIRKQERKRKLLNSSTCIDDWILEFAHLFKNHVGFNSDEYLDLHEIGVKIYTEAMEDSVTSEEAQELFNNAADKFQEMAALALFNCGNVHMSKARKRAFLTEDLYKWAQIEYEKAGERYEEALKIKPDFYEGFLALGNQEFEKAKLCWYYAVGMKFDLEKWDSKEVIQLYNKAEDNMEKGMQMWEDNEKERKRDDENSMGNKIKICILKTDMRKDEAEEMAANMRSLINILWGTMLYERSTMEYKLGLPFWHECLEIAVEKFELAGVSRTDMAVMIKNHCSNNDAPEGLGFDIDEIVQAWHEMYEVKRWQSGIPSFRLEPLLRRRVSKLFYALEHAP